MKEININSSEDLLHLEVVDLLGLLATMAVDENCDITMIVQRISSNHGNFEYALHCKRVKESESFVGKLRRWFNGF